MRAVLLINRRRNRYQQAPFYLRETDITANGYHDLSRNGGSLERAQWTVGRQISVPLYYTGLTKTARIREQEGKAQSYTLERDYLVKVPLKLASNGYTWLIIE